MLAVKVTDPPVEDEEVFGAQGSAVGEQSVVSSPSLSMSRRNWCGAPSWLDQLTVTVSP